MCPYPSQISPFLCPSYVCQAQLVSFLVRLKTYQHPGSNANCPLFENSDRCVKYEDSFISVINHINAQNFCFKIIWLITEIYILRCASCELQIGSIYFLGKDPPHPCPLNIMLGAPQDRTGQGRAGQDRAGQDRAEQGRAGQGRAG